MLDLVTKTVNWAKGFSKEEEKLLTTMMALEGDDKALILKVIKAHSDPEPAAEPLPTPSAPPGLWRPQVADDQCKGNKKHSQSPRAQAAEGRPCQAYQGSDFGDDLARDLSGLVEREGRAKNRPERSSGHGRILVCSEVQPVWKLFRQALTLERAMDRGCSILREVGGGLTLALASGNVAGARSVPTRFVQKKMIVQHPRLLHP
eukprot:s1322_g11.t1